MEPFLTIGIPTYKQPQNVRRLLESLVGQITAEYKDKIEVLIRDDSPDDSTAKIVKEYEHVLPIRYFQGEKLGIDGADFFLVEHARGTFLWWFGDDVLLPGAVKRVMTALQKDPGIDFMWINSEELGTKKMSIEMGPSRLLADANEAVEKLADLLGFLSALLFRREIAAKSIGAAQKYLGSNFGGLYPVMYVLAHSKKVYYLAESCFAADPKRPEDQLFYDSFRVFAVTFYEILMEFKGAFRWRSLKSALAKNFTGVWRSILVYRAKGYSLGMGSASVSVWPLLKRYWNFGEFWLALPFLLMPRPLLRACYKLYKMLFPQTKKRL